MEAYKRGDGVWMVPTESYDKEHEIRASGYRELTPDHPMYDEWTQYLRDQAAGTWEARVEQSLRGE